MRRYIDECLAGKTGPRGKDFNMRWVASMVADVHRILTRGGIFLYPWGVMPNVALKIRTGFAVAVPEGYEMQVRPRSELAFRHGLSLPNTPATIDSDYRGELMVALVNLGAEPFEVTRGMRIAQLIVAPVARPAFREVADLPGTARGQGGFGSTGV